MTDIAFMKQAILEASKAYQKQEVPVGCVLVVNNQVISKAYNRRQFSKKATYHAEVIAIEKACRKLKRRILEDATLYVTLEPCLMCAGVILQARIGRVVYGASEPKFGVFESLGNVFEDYNFNHKPQVTKGICEEEIQQMMKRFFQEIRAAKKQNNLVKK